MSAKAESFLALLTNLRDIFIMGRRRTIYPHVREFFGSWKELPIEDKKYCRETTEKMLEIFINTIWGICGYEFAKQYWDAFAKGDEPLDLSWDALIKGNEPLGLEYEVANTLPGYQRIQEVVGIFQEMLAEIKELPA